jgi:predicted amidohydrolase
VHICGSEKHIYSRGREFSVVDSDLGRIGAVVCYDLFFPEAARTVAVLGADILVFGAAWPKVLDPPILKHVPALEKSERSYFYDALLAVRAWENQMWLVAAAAAGSDARGSGGGTLPFDWQGVAKIVGPDGVTRVETPLFVEGLAVAHGCRITDAITTARTEEVYGDSFMFDRNPRAYAPLADEDVMYPPPVPVVHRQSHGSE